jgi:membrane protease subunit HflC
MSTRAISSLLLTGLVAVLAFGSMYTVSETDQVVITRFGKPIGKPVIASGLKFKMPFVDQVNRFDKRFLAWDGDANQMVTRDKKYIRVDTFGRWRIVDPLLFFQKVGNESGAQTRLDDIIDGATRTVVASQNLIEMVRSSNEELDRGQVEAKTQAATNDEAKNVEKVEVGREKVQQRILTQAKQPCIEMGIELLDVRIKRINYEHSVQLKVFERMISERKRIAAQYRSEGQGEAAKIRGKMEKELKEIESLAYRRSEEIRGNADAEATKVYADAYEIDPEFYSFTKTLETYRKALDADTMLVLDGNGSFARYLGSPKK